MEEQRAGLSDTLSLLDSMLENAPIGFAFFDRKFRYVRVNQFLAQMSQVPIGRHLGRTIPEMLPGPPLRKCCRAVSRGFSRPESRWFNLSGTRCLACDDTPQVWSWLYQIVYPVKGTSEAVRWVGAIVVEATERKRSEETHCGKTEKLAAAGRLAASIAHEIK